MRLYQHLVFIAMLLAGTSAAMAQGAGGGNGGSGGNGANGGPRNPTANGTILTVTEPSFMMVDNKGVETTIRTTPGTSYLMKKNGAGFKDVIQPGMRVRVAAAPDGTAGQITSNGMASSLNRNQLQAFLGATDDEWAVLKPRIDKINFLKSELIGDFGNGNLPGQQGASELETALKTLTATVFSDQTGQGVSAALGEERAIRGRFNQDLAAARGELMQIVTPKQEALLVAVQILE